MVDKLNQKGEAIDLPNHVSQVSGPLRKRESVYVVRQKERGGKEGEGREREG